MPSPLATLRERIANQVRGLTRATGGLTLDIASPPATPVCSAPMPSAGKSMPTSPR
ncbi:sensory transduction kinase domain protein [Ralstonia insidiosa]|uniref:Sensory transduction kinase domain protein n=1 Tax=Ralstonia insidiosa TaxID=190721 RepID=A0AAC9FUB4_9RALS|nr:sensory transduction kinase domain protein [Ralstonia insidiosa]